LKISFRLTDKLEEVFEIRSSPVLDRGRWTKVHFASVGLSIPGLDIQKKFCPAFSGLDEVAHNTKP